MALEKSELGVRARIPVLGRMLVGLFEIRPERECKLPKDTQLVRGSQGWGSGHLPQSQASTQRPPHMEGESGGIWVSACHLLCDLKHRLSISEPVPSSGKRD